MKESIPFYVLRFLDQIPELHLSGLGSFYRVETPARVELKEKTVYPPSRQNRFEYDEEVDASLFEGFLEYQTGKPRKQCSQMVRSFVNDLLLRLKRDGTVTYPHFGVFRLDGSSAVHFFADRANENARYLAFRPVKLHFAPAEEPETDEPVGDAVPDQNELVEAVAAATVPVGGDSGLGPDGHAGAQEAEPSGDGVHPVPEIHPEPEIIPAGNNDQSTLAVTPGEARKAAVWPWYFGSILLLLVVMALLFLYDGVPAPFFSTGESVGEVSDPGMEDVLQGRVDTQLSHGPLTGNNGTVETAEEGLKPAAEERQAVADDSESNADEENPSVPEEIDDPYAMADCMIVVGAFREKMNVMRMQTTLEGMGYRPYLMEKGSLTLVGVKRPCRTAELRSVLYEVRNEIEGGSWVLRIAGTPPPE